MLRNLLLLLSTAVGEIMAVDGRFNLDCQVCFGDAA
jgi:hypothetical protein